MKDAVESTQEGVQEEEEALEEVLYSSSSVSSRKSRPFSAIFSALRRKGRAVDEEQSW